MDIKVGVACRSGQPISEQLRLADPQFPPDNVERVDVDFLQRKRPPTAAGLLISTLPAHGQFITKDARAAE
jgi:hypothetical protein